VFCRLQLAPDLSQQYSHTAPFQSVPKNYVIIPKSVG
jgi:hypothetical protein